MPAIKSNALRKIVLPAATSNVVVRYIANNLYRYG